MIVPQTNQKQIEEKMWELAVSAVIALALVRITHRLYQWLNPKCIGKLPPGSMGFPFIGETIPFLQKLAGHDITPFVDDRTSRYGALFRTSLFGLRVIVSTDPNVNFEIFKSEKIFAFDYPESLRRIFGKDNLFFQGRNAHKCVRNLALQFFGSESLKRELIQEMNRATRENFRRVAVHGSADIKDLAASIITDCISKRMTSGMEPKAAMELEKAWKCLGGSWLQIPLSIPGTALRRRLQAHKKAMNLIKEMLEKKRKSARGSSEDSFVDTILEEIEKEESILTEERAANLIFALSLVSQKTTPTAISAAVKLLATHPEVLEELKKEHDRILENRPNPNSGITWEEYKSMIFTHMVINESLRLASASRCMFRKVAQEVEIGGYTIPAGSYILMTNSVHFDPKIYKDPFTFNPWRWKGKELRAGSKTFMAFGGGGRLCAGAEFARLQIAIFLHYLVTRYSWSIEGTPGILGEASIKFPKNLKIVISEIEN